MSGRTPLPFANERGPQQEAKAQRAEAKQNQQYVAQSGILAFAIRKQFRQGEDGG
jgi:hypothetical protein